MLVRRVGGDRHRPPRARRARRQIERIEIAVSPDDEQRPGRAIDERRVGDSENPVRHVRAGRQLRTEVPLPDDSPGGGVERVEIPVLGRDVEQVERGAVHAHVAREHGRRGDHRADVGRPDLAETADVVCAERDFARIVRRSLEIEAVRRPVRLVRERRRGGRRGRRRVGRLVASRPVSIEPAGAEDGRATLALARTPASSPAGSGRTSGERGASTLPAVRDGPPTGPDTRRDRARAEPGAGLPPRKCLSRRDDESDRSERQQDDPHEGTHESGSSLTRMVISSISRRLNLWPVVARVASPL